MSNSAFTINGSIGAVASVGVTSNVFTVTGSPVTSTGIIDVEPAQSMFGNNMIINGDFQVWQRGAGGNAIMAVAASTTAYTADRWQLQTGANQACTVTQYLSSGLPSGRFTCIVQRNSGQTGTSDINFVTSLTRAMSAGAAGQHITISFLAAAGAHFSAAGNILQVYLTTGTGSTDSSALSGWTGAVTVGQNFVLTSGQVKYTYTFPAIGSTVTQLAVTFRMTPTGTASTNDSFSITDVKLELGTAATNFQRRGFNEVLQQCQPFYEKSFSYGTAPVQDVGVSTGEYFFPSTGIGAVSIIAPTIYYQASKLSSVVSVIYNPAALNAQVRNESRSENFTGTSVGAYNERGFTVVCTGSAGTIVSDALAFHWTNDAELT